MNSRPQTTREQKLQRKAFELNERLQRAGIALSIGIRGDDPEQLDKSIDELLAIVGVLKRVRGGRKAAA